MRVKDSCKRYFICSIVSFLFFFYYLFWWHWQTGMKFRPSILTRKTTIFSDRLEWAKMEKKNTTDAIIFLYNILIYRYIQRYSNFLIWNRALLGVLEARNSNNPILRPIGRSMGWNARRRSACQRHATTRLANSSVFSTRHRCAAAAVTPHCAPLRYADVGLLRISCLRHAKPMFHFI